MATTANFGWTKPTVGGDSGAWGGILNTALDDIDTDVNTVKTTADAALPAADGTATGTTTVDHVEGAVNALGITSGTINPDITDGDIITVSTTSSLTIGVPTNLPASGTVASWLLIITTVTGSVAWNAAYNFPGGVAPTQTSTGTDIYACFTVDGGTTIHTIRTSEDSS